MGLLRYRLDGTGRQTKAIFVPKEYRGGGSKWADWKKEYDGKSNVTIFIDEVVIFECERRS